MKHSFKKLVSLVLVLAISFAMAVPAFAATKAKNSYEQQLFNEYGLDVSFNTEGLTAQQISSSYKELQEIGLQQLELRKYIAERKKAKDYMDSSILESQINLQSSSQTVTDTVSYDVFDITATYTCTSSKIGSVKKVKSKGNFTAWEKANGTSWSQTSWKADYIDSHRTAAVTVYGTYVMGVDVSSGKQIAIHNYEIYGEFSC